MTINAVSDTAALTGAQAMGMEDFLKVLMTQLVYQDPLKPMDNQQFMAQMAQFTALQQAQQTNEKLAMLVANQAALQSVGLIGRTVDVTTNAGTVTGVVAALSLAGPEPSMTITTPAGASLEDIGITQVTGVR
jgi:flagellar basal-body rod modification protein FlgD